MSCDRRHNLPVFAPSSRVASYRTRPRTEARADDYVGRCGTNSTAFVMMSSDFVLMVKERSGLAVLLLHSAHQPFQARRLKIDVVKNGPGAAGCRRASSKCDPRCASISRVLFQEHDRLPNARAGIRHEIFGLGAAAPTTLVPSACKAKARTKIAAINGAIAVARNTGVVPHPSPSIRLVVSGAMT